MVPCIHIHALCSSWTEKLTFQTSFIPTFMLWSLLPYVLFQCFSLLHFMTPFIVPHTSLLCQFYYSTFFRHTSKPLNFCSSFSSHTHLPSLQCNRLNPPNKRAPSVYHILMHFFPRQLLLMIQIPLALILHTLFVPVLRCPSESLSSVFP